MNKVNKTLLNNGIRLVTIPREESLGVTVLVLVKAGLLTENKDRNGISHFIEHMCFKGTKNWPTSIVLAREFESMGASYNAFTSEESTGYYATVLPKHTNRVIEILADMYLNPIYDPKEIEKERGVIKEEIKLYEDLPSRHVWSIFSTLTYGEQPAGWDIIGTRENIDKFQLDNFHEYREELYKGANTVIVVAGKIDEVEVKKKVDSAFAPVAASAEPVMHKGRVLLEKGRVSVVYRDIGQSHLVIGFPGVDLFHPDLYKIYLLARVLGVGMSSRLFQTIREEMGIAYHVSADHDTFSNYGFFSIYAGVHPEKASAAVTEAWKQAKKLTEEEVTEQELRIAKDSFISGLELSLETSDAQASYFGASEILRNELLTPEQIAEKIEAVTKADIKEMAQKIFVPQEARLAVLGPHRDDREFVNLLTV